MKFSDREGVKRMREALSELEGAKVDSIERSSLTVRQQIQEYGPMQVKAITFKIAECEWFFECVERTPLGEFDERIKQVDELNETALAHVRLSAILEKIEKLA